MPNGIRAILAAGTLGLGATMLVTAPANAVPWGQADYWGVAQHATNCACAVPQQAASQTPQAPVQVAKQTNPSVTQERGGAGQRQR